jgi:nicotinic acid phosphoribosyltransferase
VSRATQLNLTETGGAELLDAEGSTLWASDTDEDFRDEFLDFLQESDVPAVIDYLLDGEIIDEYEAEALEVGEWAQTRTMRTRPACGVTSF